jgi:hypothetical protein
MLGTVLSLFAAAVIATSSFISIAGEDDESKKPVKITAQPSKASPDLKDVNQGRFNVAFAIKNTGKEDTVIWPYLSVQILDSEGKSVEKTRDLGRWGLIRSPSILEEVHFVTLKPGKTHTIVVNLNQYMHDADKISAWRLAKPGKYKAVLHYSFDRAETKKKYGKGCQAIDDPTKPWNQALEVDEKIEVKLSVK